MVIGHTSPLMLHIIKTKWIVGFNRQIDVLGADHGGYVKRVQSVLTALSDGKATLDVKLCQMVKLMRER